MVKIIRTNAEFRETLTGAQGKLVVIDFFATWCGPCNAIAPVIQQFSEKYKNVVFIKVDVDNQELEGAVQEYNINCMPTFVYVKSGKEIDRLEGASQEKLEAKVKQHSG